MSELWTALLPLGGAVIGFAGATLTTGRQLRHNREMEENRLRRETFGAFVSSAVQWTDAAMLYGESQATGAGDEFVIAQWERQGAEWVKLTDAYSMLLLVATPETLRRVDELYDPAQER